MSPEPQLDSLDRAFTLPEVIDPDDSKGLRTLYEVIVHRLRREATHLTMTTVQELLLERIAYNYVVMRWQEIRDAWVHTTAQKEFNTFWLAMTAEFNKLTRTSSAEAREAILREARDVIVSGLADIQDPKTRADVKKSLIGAFERAGL